LRGFGKATAIDLVLDYRMDQLETVLAVPLDELRDRANRDKIRQIHLRSNNPDLLSSTLYSLTPDGEDGVQEKYIDSIIFDSPTIPEELSGFFARSRLPWLRHLESMEP
jgi:hypothetical protein